MGRGVLLPRLLERLRRQVEADLSSLNAFDHVPIDPMVLPIVIFRKLDPVLPVFMIDIANQFAIRRTRPQNGSRNSYERYSRIAGYR
jgi:hypothetical protein